MPAYIAHEYTYVSSTSTKDRMCDGGGIHTIMEEEESLVVTSLHNAVLANDVVTFRRLVGEGVDPNTTNQNGSTSLHLAAKHNSLDIVHVLLNSQGVLFDAPDAQGKTSLHLAIEYQHFTIASCLIQNGASLHIQDDFDLVPLDYCLSMRQPIPNKDKLADFFVRHLPEFCKTELKSERRAVCILAYWDSAKLLQKAVAEDRSIVMFQDKHRQSPLHYCFSGDSHVSLDSAKVLLAAGADINDRNVDGATPLHFLAAHALCSERGSEEFVCTVTTSHCQIDGMSPLHIASATGDTDLLKYLAKCGSDLNLPDQDGFTALHLAALHGHADVVNTLVRRRASVNPENQKKQIPLHYASVLPRITCARILVNAGGGVAAQDEFGMAPLHKAAGWGTPDMVKLLIQKAADINVEDTLGQLPIHYSALKGLTEITELLILKGSRVECPDKNGQTPLHLAAKTGNADIIKLLLLHGSDPNTQDVKGQSPLHLACCHGNKDAVQTLINRGASKNVVTTKGHTPDQFASERGFYGILSILREHRQSLSLYAPEQLKTFEMFRNATAPTRLESLGQEDEESGEDDHGHSPHAEHRRLVDAAMEDATSDVTGDDDVNNKLDLHGDENANLRVDNDSLKDEGVIYMKPRGKGPPCNGTCCSVS